MNTKISGRYLEKELEDINYFIEYSCKENEKRIKTLGVSFATENFEYVENYLSLSNLIMLLLQTGAEYIFLHDPRGHLKKNVYEVAKAVERIIYDNNLGITTYQITDNQICLESTSSSGPIATKSTVVFCSEVDGSQGIEQFLEIQRASVESGLHASASMEDDITMCMYEAMGLSIPREMIHTEYKSIDLLLVIGSTETTHGFLPWLIAFTEIIWIPSLSSTNAARIISCLEKYFGCEKRYGK